MDRRTFVSGVTLSLLAAPLAAEGQQPGKIPHIGVLASRSPEAPGPSELVRLNVDVIVAANNAAVAAASRATRTIPIVMVLAEDPVASGFVESLRRPGGNITGLSSQWAELFSKRLQLLREAAPHVSRVAVLWDGQWLLRETKGTAPAALGLRLQLIEVRQPSELEASFAMVTREGEGALLVQGSTMLLGQRTRLGELMLKGRLPGMCTLREYVEAGCLMSYGVDFADTYRRAAGFVDKILKGAKPADLPVEQPTEFEFVINLKTARALGLAISPSLLQRAQHVIE